MTTKEKFCSFFGHRNTVATPQLCENLKQTIIGLIEEKGVTRFLFGSTSKFDDLCVKTVTELKERYPEIKRVYVRSVYPKISKRYENYLYKYYDEIYMPERIINAGRASYIERNQEMINASDFCIFYYDETYKPPIRKQSKNPVASYQPKSGTKLAYEYALQKNKSGLKTIINVYEQKIPEVKLLEKWWKQYGREQLFTRVYRYLRLRRELLGNPVYQDMFDYCRATLITYLKKESPHKISEAQLGETVDTLADIFNENSKEKVHTYKPMVDILYDAWKSIDIAKLQISD